MISIAADCWSPSLGGGLISGLDRIITARMQSRIGPPVLAGFLRRHQAAGQGPMVVNVWQAFCAYAYISAASIAVVLFFLKSDLLLILFVQAVGAIFVVVGALSSTSPYSQVGAHRELLQILAYEPLMILVMIGIYLKPAASSSRTSRLASATDAQAALSVRRARLRPDHQAAQVALRPLHLPPRAPGAGQGAAHGFSGPFLALTEIGHWYEVVLLLGLCTLFWSTQLDRDAGPARVDLFPGDPHRQRHLAHEVALDAELRLGRRADPLARQSHLASSGITPMQALKRFVNGLRAKSPWILHFDCGSCNGCDIEVLACLTPRLRRGAVRRSSTSGNRNTPISSWSRARSTTATRSVLANLYDQMPEPKIVVAIGACGLSGGIFRDAYNVVGGIDKVIPVDVYVPGCAAQPEAIIDGVVLGLQKLQGLGEAKGA